NAVISADVIYSDRWTSMGQEAEHARRLKHFAGFQIDAKLLARAPKHVKVMHCLPAHRGEEISEDAMEGPQSIVFPQAGNRMHAQKALLKWLLTCICFVRLSYYSAAGSTPRPCLQWLSAMAFVVMLCLSIMANVTPLNWPLPRALPLRQVLLNT